MRLQSNPWAASLLVAASLWAVLLGSCSDDTPSTATTDGGSATGGAAAGSSAGGTTSGSSSAGTSGSTTAGSSAGGVAGSASAGNGGGGQTNGGGGSGGTTGGGNGGTGGAPRVYTIEGCDEPGAGGAGNSGGESNAGGNSGAPEGGAGEGGAGSIIPDISASFTVYDFVTDKPVQTCVDRVSDFEITITGDAPLTVAANLPPGLMPGSVLWTYDGTAIMAHNIFPYTLGPDDNGDYQEPTPPLTAGEHVLSITVYAEADAMGAVLGQASIIITVVEG